jgi:hypothetical protein
MGSVDELLRGIAPEAQREIQQRLGGFLGGFVKAYLPQTWVFQTEEGAASLVVDAMGRVAVEPGAAKAPDVTIEVGYERLRTGLLTRRKESTAPGPLNVTPHTAKGRTAFDYLRGRLGL